MLVKKLKLLGLSSLVFLLAGCGQLSGEGSDNTLKPVPLVKFKSSIVVKERWNSHPVKEINTIATSVCLTAYQNHLFAVDTDGRVVAIQADNGETAWKTRLDSQVSAGPAVDDNVVVVATHGARLFGINANNGKQLWQINLPNQVIAVPLVDNDRVFVKTIDGKLLALNAANGKTLWMYDHGAPLMAVHGNSAPVMSDNRLIVGFADGKLAALDSNNGRLIWESVAAMPGGMSDVERITDIDATPLVVGNTLYVTTYQGKLLAINAHNGNLIWSTDAAVDRDVAANQNHLFITDLSSHVFSFDRFDGKKGWEQSQLEGRHLTAPVLMGQWLIVGDEEGYLHWLSQRDGSLLARVRADKSGISVKPLVMGNRLYVLTNKGKLYLFQ